MLKKDTPVTIKHTTLTGVVLRPVVVQDEVQYLVEYKDNEGETQQRVFTDAQIEAIPPKTEE